MEDSLKAEIIQRLRAGEPVYRIASDLKIPRWQVEHQKAYLRSGVILGLEVNDRVACADGSFAWVERVIPGGAVLRRDGRQWYAKTQEFGYAPTPAVIEQRAATVRAMGLSALDS